MAGAPLCTVAKASMGEHTTVPFFGESISERRGSSSIEDFTYPNACWVPVISVCVYCIDRDEPRLHTG